jgi:hypothetical protein
MDVKKQVPDGAASYASDDPQQHKSDDIHAIA